MSGDDEILLAGSLSLEWDDSGSYNTDFAAVKLDSDGNELWDFKASGDGLVSGNQVHAHLFVIER